MQLNTPPPTNPARPRRRPAAFALALAGAGLLVALQACRATPPSRTLEATIAGAVEDPGRRAELLELVRERGRAQALFVEQRANLEQRLKATNADPRASAAQLRAVADAFERDYGLYRAAVLDAAAEMRALTTPEEWAAIHEADLAAILATELGGR